MGDVNTGEPELADSLGKRAKPRPAAVALRYAVACPGCPATECHGDVMIYASDTQLVSKIMSKRVEAGAALMGAAATNELGKPLDLLPVFRPLIS